VIAVLRYLSINGSRRETSDTLTPLLLKDELLSGVVEIIDTEKPCDLSQTEKLSTNFAGPPVSGGKFPDNRITCLDIGEIYSF